MVGNKGKENSHRFELNKFGALRYKETLKPRYRIRKKTMTD